MPFAEVLRPGWLLNRMGGKIRDASPKFLILRRSASFAPSLEGRTDRSTRPSRPAARAPQDEEQRRGRRTDTLNRILIGGLLVLTSSAFASCASGQAPCWISRVLTTPPGIKVYFSQRSRVQFIPVVRAGLINTYPPVNYVVDNHEPASPGGANNPAVIPNLQAKLGDRLSVISVPELRCLAIVVAKNGRIGLEVQPMVSAPILPPFKPGGPPRPLPSGEINTAYFIPARPE